MADDIQRVVDAPNQNKLVELRRRVFEALGRQARTVSLAPLEFFNVAESGFLAGVVNGLTVVSNNPYWHFSEVVVRQVISELGRANLEARVEGGFLRWD